MIIKKYNFGDIYIYDCYVVVIMKEGVIVKPENNLILEEISNTYFKNKGWGYISNRINSYSIDPRIYIETAKINNLVAFAIVSTNSIGLLNTEIEKLFFKKPFEHFFILNEAVDWIKSTLKDVKIEN